MLADPTRLTHHGAEPKWLLSGIAMCGMCNSPVGRQKNRGYDSYVCKTGFCVSRNIAPLDEYVIEAILRRLEGQDLIGDMDTADDAALEAMAAARSLRQRLDAFTDSAADGELTATALARIESKLRPQIAAADARASSVMRSPLVGDVAGMGAREKWMAMSVMQRRELVRAVVSIRLHKATKRQRFRAGDGTVELLWT